MGTCMALEDEEEPREGRLLVFHVARGEGGGGGGGGGEEEGGGGGMGGGRDIQLVAEKATKVRLSAYSPLPPSLNPSLNPSDSHIYSYSLSPPPSLHPSIPSTQGAVYCLNPFNGKLLAGINSKVQLYRWAEKDGSPELQVRCLLPSLPPSSLYYIS